MQILPNCLYVVAHGSSRTTVCVEGMHKSYAALTLHTSVLSKTFVIKSCTNPARHIFPWLPREVVGLHTGVLTKTFAMSVLYLKTIEVFSKENLFISLYIKRENASLMKPYLSFSHTANLYSYDREFEIQY